jgi:hypothetical protein
MTGKKPQNFGNAEESPDGMGRFGASMDSPIADVAERVSSWDLPKSTASTPSSVSQNASDESAKSGLLTANVSTTGFDKTAYMREYMRVWRKRKKGEDK